MPSTSTIFTSSDFPRQIYGEAKKLFPEGVVETLAARPSSPGAPGATETFDSAVRLIHTPTGLEITCEEFPSQIENFIAAAIRLKIACDQRERNAETE